MISLGQGRWNKNVRHNWAVTSSLDTVIRQLELARPDLLPNLQFSPKLMLTSDYSGQHKAATHEAFSFLLADLAHCGLWFRERESVRQTFFTDKRRMSYKALNDRHRRLALPRFLAAADHIPGVLVTIMVGKRFSDSLKLTAEERAYLPPAIIDWPAHVVAKMTIIAHLDAILVAGLSASKQNLLWFTDNDDFVANDQRVIDLTSLFAGIIGSYVGHEMGHFRYGTMKYDPGDLQIEDLASIPDLAAGAACEIPFNNTLRSQSSISVPLRDYVSPKALTVLHWFGQRKKTLKRLAFVVEDGDHPSTVKVKALDLQSE